MTASPSDLAAGIAPGSLEYGDRAPLEAGLSAGGGTPSPGGAPTAGGPPPPVDSVKDPLAALLNGDIKPGETAEGTLTDGLSVGPGEGPAGTSGAADPKLVKLQIIAQTAESPIVRAAARNELRQMVKEPL